MAGCAVCNVDDVFRDTNVTRSSDQSFKLIHSFIRGGEVLEKTRANFKQGMHGLLKGPCSARKVFLEHLLYPWGDSFFFFFFFLDSPEVALFHAVLSAEPFGPAPLEPHLPTSIGIPPRTSGTFSGALFERRKRQQKLWHLKTTWRRQIKTRGDIVWP